MEIYTQWCSFTLQILLILQYFLVSSHFESFIIRLMTQSEFIHQFVGLSTKFNGDVGNLVFVYFFGFGIILYISKVNKT